MSPHHSLPPSVLEEDLRESASIGDADRLTSLLASGVDVNARHAINGWTALHWAVHRGYPTICRLLLRHGGDPNVKNQKGETPAKLTERPDILQMLGESVDPGDASNAATSTTSSTSGQLPIVPNYLRNPPFPYGRPSSAAAPKLASPSSDDAATASEALRAVGAMSRLSLESGVNADCSTAATTPSAPPQRNNHYHNIRANDHQECPTAKQINDGNHYHIPDMFHPHQHLPYPGYNPDELVVKVRIEGHPDSDFIEVELPRGPGLDFELLLDILSEELGVPKNLISKVRKRPDTILRKDRDLMRLRDFEELEVVVSQTPVVSSPANGGRYLPRYGSVDARILY